MIGRSNVPAEGPIIFTGNHANQFVDALQVRLEHRHTPTPYPAQLYLPCPSLFSSAKTVQIYERIRLYQIKSDHIIPWSASYNCKRVALHVSYHSRVVSHRIMSYRIVSYHIVSYHVKPYGIMSYRVVWYHIIPYHIISYRIISYDAIPYRIVSYRVV